MPSNDKGSSFWVFLGGMTIGLVAAVLFAPQSGEETRERIAETAKEGRYLLEDAVDELKYQVNTSVHDAKERVADAVQQGSKAYRHELEIRRSDEHLGPRPRGNPFVA